MMKINTEAVVVPKLINHVRMSIIMRELVGSINGEQRKKGRPSSFVIIQASKVRLMEINTAAPLMPKRHFSTNPIFLKSVENGSATTCNLANDKKQRSAGYKNV